MFAYGCWFVGVNLIPEVQPAGSHTFTPVRSHLLGWGGGVGNEVNEDCRRDWITLDTNDLNEIKQGVIPEGKSMASEEGNSCRPALK